MTAKKRGKRPGLRGRSKNARESREVLIARRKSEAERVTDATPLTCMEREELREVQTKLKLAHLQLAHCRNVMEANDPGNALTIFGPPITETAKAEGESGEARSDEAQNPDNGEMP